MKLLVAGGDRVDAGKTTFSVGLCQELSAPGYKPRAGNDYWFDQDDYRHAIEDGRLYGKDAKRLAAASPGSPDPEECNPVHRLWIPTPGEGTGVLGQDGRAFVCDRVRTPSGDDEYVVNGARDVPDSARSTLPLADARTVESLTAFNEVMQSLHLPALAGIEDRIAAEDRAVVESYANIARPSTTLDIDAVAIVEPRRCRVYDGERYQKACEVASGSAREGQLEERVANVVSLIDPVATVELPALGSEERSDPTTIASAYDHAYDALVATAL